MDETTERMGALKRAYAEIILNVTKESTARVLTAEVKAMRLRKELATSKEEAVRTFLRVKGIMDAKIRDAQKASSAQARRVQDLEALLEESRKTINSLEAELMKVRQKMDVELNTVETLNNESVLNNYCHHEDPKVDLLSGSILHCDNLEPICQSPHDKTLSNKHAIIFVDSHGEIPADSLQRKPTEVINSEGKLCCGPDLDSIGRLKEPDLCRSGFKQRIRAFELNTGTREVPYRHEDQFLKFSQSKNGSDHLPQVGSCNSLKTAPDFDALKISDVGPDYTSSRKIIKRKKKGRQMISAKRSVMKKRRGRPIKFKNRTVQALSSGISKVNKPVSVADTLYQSDTMPEIISSGPFFVRKQKIRRKRKKLEKILTPKKNNVPRDYLVSSRNSNQCPHDAHISVTPSPIGESGHGSLSCQTEGMPFVTEIKPMETNVVVDNADSKEISRASESSSFLRRCFQNSQTSSSYKMDVSASVVDCDALEEPLEKINPAKTVFPVGNSDTVGGCGTGWSLNQAPSNGFLKYTFKRKRLRGTQACLRRSLFRRKVRRAVIKIAPCQNHRKVAYCEHHLVTIGDLLWWLGSWYLYLKKDGDRMTWLGFDIYTWKLVTLLKEVHSKSGSGFVAYFPLL